MTKLNQSNTRNLILYFIIAYAFTWLLWIPEALATRGRLGSSIIVDFLLGPNNPAAWGPFVAAFSLTYLNEGIDGVIRLLKRAVDIRFAKVWWIPIVLLFPLINGGALFLAKFSGEAIPELFWLTSPFLIVVYFIQYLLTGGPLQEEFGWRGYALPRLQARFNALISSVILGSMWSLWHLPYFWIGEEVIYQYIWGHLLSAILISIIITWLLNNTGGSILVALISHNMFIMANVLFPALETQVGSLFYLIFIIATVIAVVVIWGPKRLVRLRGE
jgi:membrane protease YdiL (CAAX protease family)